MTPVFKTDKKYNENSSNLKKMFEEYLAFTSTGGEIVFVSDDFLEVHLKFNLSELTKNPNGTGFGGAIYSSLDPIYPLQFWHLLDRSKYVVWDLAATINYLKPITKDVYAKFLLTAELMNDIKQKIRDKNKTVITLPVEYRDLEDNIYAKATKTIYIADKVYFESKNKALSK